MKSWNGCTSFQRRYIFVLYLHLGLIPERKGSLFTVYSCALQKVGSCTVTFMIKNSDADISGKGKSQTVFCSYTSCWLKCWHFGRKIKQEMVKSAGSLQWAQKKTTQNGKEKILMDWGRYFQLWLLTQISHLFTKRNSVLHIPSTLPHKALSDLHLPQAFPEGCEVLARVRAVFNSWCSFCGHKYQNKA